MSFARLAAILALALVMTPMMADGVSAQTRVIAASAAVGTGLSVGGGNGTATLKRSPLFVDVALRTWSSEETNIAYGGSVRIEVEDRASVAVVPRVEMSHLLGPLRVRGGVGLPVFFAPFTMAGIELSADIGLPIGDVFHIGGMLFIDAFVLGSDVPEGAAVIMINAMLGAEIAL